ncbi:MAG: PIG-L deacetylase family protein [Solirubrobacterales bacterium]
MLDLRSISRALCFFAHPDDETLGAGATMHRLGRLGSEVHVAIPATGIHARRNVESETLREERMGTLREDCSAALAMLAIDPTRIHLGEFADNELDRYTRLELIHWLEALIDTVRPDVILTHHRYCTNIDHQYCHEAAIVATRPSVSSHVSLLAGEVPSSTGYLRPARWEPNLYVEISEEDLEGKISAMEAYKGEARPDPHPRSPEVLRALAKVRGSESGYSLAEAFMVQRAFG